MPRGRRARAENQSEVQRCETALAEAERLWRDKVHEHTKLGQRPSLKRERDQRDDLTGQLEELQEVDAALVDGVKQAELGVRRAVLEGYPSLMSEHETRCQKIAADREALEQRHAEEQAEQIRAEQRARGYSVMLLEPFGALFNGHFRNGMIPEVRPDRPEADLAPYEPEPWWPDWRVAVWEHSKELARRERERLVGPIGIPVAANETSQIGDAA